MIRTFQVTFTTWRGRAYAVQRGNEVLYVHADGDVTIACEQGETLTFTIGQRSRSVRIVGDARFNWRIVGMLLLGKWDWHASGQVGVYRGRMHEQASCNMCSAFRVVV